MFVYGKCLNRLEFRQKGDSDFAVRASIALLSLGTRESQFPIVLASEAAGELLWGGVWCEQREPVGQGGTCSI